MYKSSVTRCIIRQRSLLRCAITVKFNTELGVESLYYSVVVMYFSEISAPPIVSPISNRLAIEPMVDTSRAARNGERSSSTNKKNNRSSRFKTLVYSLRAIFPSRYISAAYNGAISYVLRRNQTPISTSVLKACGFKNYLL